MSNILFIGPYLQSDGWGYAAREYIRALRRTKHNVAIRPVYLNMQNEYKIFPEFDDLEVNLSSYDVIIQNCLPHQYRYYGGVKNIGLSYFETSTISGTPWVPHLNLMDEIWVASSWEEETLRISGVTSDINKVNLPVDTTKYDKQYTKYPFVGHDHEFKFYFIGEYITRKNVQLLIKAFHLAFPKYENVRLILKVNQVGVDPSLLLQKISQDISLIKRSLGLYQNSNEYKAEIIMANYVSDEEIYGIHEACDCFVMPSYGEAFCMPAFDAMMFGNFPIVNKNSSMSEYLYGSLGKTVKSKKVPAIAIDRPLNFLYTGRDYWYEMDLCDLIQSMQYAYMTQKQKGRKELAKTNVLPEYTYDAVASTINEIL